MSESIFYRDASELAALIRAKKLSPVEVVQSHLDRIAAINPRVNVVVTMAEEALERAKQAERAIMQGKNWGPLHGVPFTIKDVFDTKGVKTTRGSLLFKDRVPAADAAVVSRLKKAGGILLAKTSLPEFALQAETSNRLIGRTENPWKVGRTCGGSSGGEGAAIVAGLSPMGVGSDLGGSNRLPAHYCGIVGFKPTHGRIPLTGHWPELLVRYMHAGPLARSVRDVALALSVLTGPDGVDPYAVPVPAAQLPNLQAPLPKLRVGWCAEGPFKPVDAEIQETVGKAAKALKALGCQIEPVTLAEWNQRNPIDLVMTLLFGEGVHYLKQRVAEHEKDLTPSVFGLLASPKPTLDKYVKAMADCELLRQDMAKYFQKYDLLLIPTGPLSAPRHEAQELVINGTTVPASHAAVATAAFGVTGSPAISVPFDRSRDGLPIGVQLVGRHYDEGTLLHAASHLESSSPAGRQRPPL